MLLLTSKPYKGFKIKRSAFKCTSKTELHNKLICKSATGDKSIPSPLLASGQLNPKPQLPSAGSQTTGEGSPPLSSSGINPDIINDKSIPPLTVGVEPTADQIKRSAVIRDAFILKIASPTKDSRGFIQTPQIPNNLTLQDREVILLEIVKCQALRAECTKHLTNMQLALQKSNKTLRAKINKARNELKSSDSSDTSGGSPLNTKSKGKSIEIPSLEGILKESFADDSKSALVFLEDQLKNENYQLKASILLSKIKSKSIDLGKYLKELSEGDSTPPA